MITKMNEPKNNDVYSRRTILGAGLALPLVNYASGLATPARAKKLLVLGGTRFLGPTVVRAALAAGWEVTLFNRGKSGPGLFRDLEQLEGDRDTGDLESLRNRKWDACIDTSGYAPLHVQQSCELLRDAVAHYVFVSTVSVYKDQSGANIDEATPAPLPTADQISAAKTIGQGMANYAPMKAACEAAAERAMPGRVTIVRSGLIVGPEDESDRFTYWPWRVARGGEVLAPADPDAEIQFVDVRDLGNWCFRMAAAGTAGVMNAVGFRGRLSFAEFLGGCKVMLNTEATFTWVDEKFLNSNRVRPYMDLPLWLPNGRYGHLDNRKAIAAGLTFRSVADTIRDTGEWLRTRPADYAWRAGLTPAREQALLRAWSTRGR